MKHDETWLKSGKVRNMEWNGWMWSKCILHNLYIKHPFGIVLAIYVNKWWVKRRWMHSGRVNQRMIQTRGHTSAEMYRQVALVLQKCRYAFESGQRRVLVSNMFWKVPLCACIGREWIDRWMSTYTYILLIPISRKINLSTLQTRSWTPCPPPSSWWEPRIALTCWIDLCWDPADWIGWST